jgi:hypothetical protein
MRHAYAEQRTLTEDVVAEHYQPRGHRVERGLGDRDRPTGRAHIDSKALHPQQFLVFI